MITPNTNVILLEKPEYDDNGRLKLFFTNNSVDEEDLRPSDKSEAEQENSEPLVKQ